ncbi:MAG: hypothetical protein C0415_02120 [Thermodesulfovibrio sp.]|nr:hypothetical protein [Thermodesulfovibrio sp.]
MGRAIEVRGQQSVVRRRLFILFIISCILSTASYILFFISVSYALTDEQISIYQAELKGKTAGEKIAFWAESFLGTPYDKDPLGEYVSKATITADERVDCMYLTFRSVELALSNTPEEAIQTALDRRFHSMGIIKDGRVLNYSDRFDYGEDMIYSGKWGREITSEIGRTIRIKGSRGKDFFDVLTYEELMRRINRLESGDIIFFAEHPDKRTTDAIIKHMGIIKIEVRRHPSAKGGAKSEVREVYLIHASGLKGKGGVVKKVLLKNYLNSTSFAGVKVTRFP